MQVRRLRATWPFQALADDTRLRTARLLAIAERPLVAGTLAMALDLPPAHLSRHLKVLEAAGIATVASEGRWRWIAFDDVRGGEPLRLMLADLPDEAGRFSADAGRLAAAGAAALPGRAARRAAVGLSEASPPPRSQEAQYDADERVLSGLLARRSVSPKRLAAPGPDMVRLDVLLQAALRAPDHGGLHPWRVIEFRADSRAALADLFEAEKRRRDPLATPLDVLRARDHATRPPVLLAFVVSPRPRAAVPRREQELGAGAALGNLLNAAHQLGIGAIVLSGERCHDDGLASRLGLQAHEYLAGFVSLGRITEAPPPARLRQTGKVWSCWIPRDGPSPHTSPPCDRPSLSAALSEAPTPPPIPRR